jgi:hypothetical protein
MTANDGAARDFELTSESATLDVARLARERTGQSGAAAGLPLLATAGAP